MSEKHPSLAEAYEAPVAGRKQPQPGDILDGTYRVEGALGRGGVGVVHAATHLHVQRPCAVKFLHPQLVGNPELRARFKREAQSAFQLGHPHIVSITDFRDDPAGWPYLVMELVSGANLRDRLDEGPLPPELAVRLMMQLCDALYTAHRRGVIHRDLKPENLFLVPVDNRSSEPSSSESAGLGGEIFLKVLDFGLSKILDDVEITETGRLLGSPSYMSPEQARGDSHLVDARSDIFAVGSLLYECLIGDKLFEAPSFDKKRKRIIAAELPPMDFAAKGLSPRLELIIRTACAREPEARFQTAADLLVELGQVYDEELASHPTAPRDARSSRRMPAVSGSHGVLPTLSPMNEQRSGRLRRPTPSPMQAVAIPGSGPAVGAERARRATGQSRAAGSGVTPASVESRSTAAALATPTSLTPTPSAESLAARAVAEAAPTSARSPSQAPPPSQGSRGAMTAPPPPSQGSRESQRPASPAGLAAMASTSIVAQQATPLGGEVVSDHEGPSSSVVNDRATPTIPQARISVGEVEPRGAFARLLHPQGVAGWATLIVGGFFIGGAVVLMAVSLLRSPEVPAPPGAVGRPAGVGDAVAPTGARPPSGALVPSTSPRSGEPGRGARKAGLRRVSLVGRVPPVGGAAVEEPPAAKPTGDETVVAVGSGEQEPLAFRVVNAVMMKHRRSIARCFAPDVALPRRLVVDAVVQPAGQVSEASTEVSAEAGSCIVDALRGITFPSFQGADPVSVHFEYVNLRRE